MNTNEFLAVTRKAHDGIDMLEIRPAATMKDDFIISIQASETHYCSPRNNNGPYLSVELGYPSGADDLIMEFAEDARCPTRTVYGYVPVEVVDALIEKHGGIKA